MKDFAELFGLAAIGSHNTAQPLQQNAVTPAGDPHTWTQHAACHPRHKPDDMTPAEWTNRWYPRRGENHIPTLRTICARCPVIDECRREALAETPGDMHGFRAGMTPKERRQTRRNSPPETSRDKVARLAADGLTDQQIGDLIGLTRHTVKWHRQALGVRKDNHGRIVA